MTRFLKWSLSLFTVLFSTLLTGCIEEGSHSLNLQFKDLTEYVDDLNNITVNMEVVIDGDHSNYLFTNDSQIYVNSKKDNDGHEYGYVFDTSDNTLFSIDRNKIGYASCDDDALNTVTDLISKSYLLFFTSLQDPIITYKGKSTVAGRLCHSYKAVVNNNGKEIAYHIDLDDETELCLRCNCISNKNTIMLFETKTFEKAPNTTEYIKAIESFRNNNE